MQKKFNKLWVWGDSYSTPNYCVQPQQSFWGLAAQQLAVQTICNQSWPGNSFDSIVHMLISMQEQFDWQHDFFLIGIPPLERMTVFDNFKDTRYHAAHIDTATWSIDPQPVPCVTGLQNLRGADSQQLVVYLDRAWTETQTLAKIFLLTQWLDQHQAHYAILNLSKPLDANNIWGPSGYVLPYCQNHNRCVLFDNTYYSVNIDQHQPADFLQHGWLGHHGPAGNQHFFETTVRNLLC